MRLLVVPLSCLLMFLAAADEPASPGSRVATEFRAGLVRRGIQDSFALYQQYARGLFDASRGDKTFSDKTGNCRLGWVEQLVTQPLDAIEQADRFTRELFADAAALDGLPRVLNQVAAKLDASDAATPAAMLPHQPLDPLERVRQAIERARQAMDAALKPLSAAEQVELREDLYPQTTSLPQLGHRFADKDRGRRVADLLERLDRRRLLQAARELAALTDANLLAELAKTEARGTPAALGITGSLLRLIETPQGAIVVGGPGKNEYRLDELSHVCAVIDTGGDDLYLEGTTTARRPVLVVLDLAGNDIYRGEQPGIQGGAILGASLLVDLEGNDSYSARDVAQGSALGGVGLLIDGAGQDEYRGDRRVQGQAVAGCGLLIDRGGDDRYRGALLAQGVGGPLGLGLLADIEGRDHYFAGGKYPGGYDDSPGFGGWSQGVGIGPRGVANGGIGVLLDGAGDDIYEADYFSHGGGYWFAAGMARDFGGDDQRLGATRENFDGSPRTVDRFLRWGTGFGCHYAAGFLFDDCGNDTYAADMAAIAYGWDISVAVVCDLDGDDRYVTTGTGVAQGHNACLAILYDRAGNDHYQGGGLGAADTENSYHSAEKSGGTFVMLLDDSGEDQLGQGLQNHSEVIRGWAGGLFIDR